MSLIDSEKLDGCVKESLVKIYEFITERSSSGKSLKNELFRFDYHYYNIMSNHMRLYYLLDLKYTLDRLIRDYLYEIYEDAMNLHLSDQRKDLGYNFIEMQISVLQNGMSLEEALVSLNYVLECHSHAEDELQVRDFSSLGITGNDIPEDNISAAYDYLSSVKNHFHYHLWQRAPVRRSITDYATIARHRRGYAGTKWHGMGGTIVEKHMKRMDDKIDKRNAEMRELARKEEEKKRSVWIELRMRFINDEFDCTTSDEEELIKYITQKRPKEKSNAVCTECRNKVMRALDNNSCECRSDYSD
jgi:hypothetical protein